MIGTLFLWIYWYGSSTQHLMQSCGSSALHLNDVFAMID